MTLPERIDHAIANIGTEEVESLLDVLRDAKDAIAAPADVSFLSFDDVLNEVARRTTACVVAFMMPVESGNMMSRTSYRCSGALMLGIGLSQMLNKSLVRDCLALTAEEKDDE